MPNIREALQFCVTDDPAIALQMVTHAGRYWQIRGMLSEGRQWLDLALSTAASAPPRLRARGLYYAVLAAVAQGDFPVARMRIDEGRALLGPMDDPELHALIDAAAQANEQIGIAQSAFFPSLRLSGSAGLGAASIGDLFSASALVWSLGASLVQTIFDAGATSARVEGARAGVQEAAARYRQTVLSAFQDVEDQLVASRILQQQLLLREQAARAANLVEEQVLNRYQAGQVSYTEVVNAQVTAHNARRAVAQALSDRQVAAVALIQALGGGWRGL
jgi:hypothetical protein